MRSLFIYIFLLDRQSLFLQFYFHTQKLSETRNIYIVGKYTKQGKTESSRQSV